MNVIVAVRQYIDRMIKDSREGMKVLLMDKETVRRGSLRGNGARLSDRRRLTDLNRQHGVRAVGDPAERSVSIRKDRLNGPRNDERPQGDLLPQTDTRTVHPTHRSLRELTFLSHRTTSTR